MRKRKSIVLGTTEVSMSVPIQCITRLSRASRDGSMLLVVKMTRKNFDKLGDSIESAFWDEYEVKHWEACKGEMDD